MFVKQERSDLAVNCPRPPPLLHQGLVRMNPPIYAPHGPLMYPVTQAPSLPPAIQPRPPMLQRSPAAPAETSKAVPPPEASMSEAEINKRIDKASIKGAFGWETVDDANIPCIFRNDEKYVSVRMVEQKLLSKYPSTYPQELLDRPPLMSQFITGPESKLLNEINIEHCACEYGQRAFTEKDLVVSLKDFMEFYRIVKKHFPNELKAQDQQPAKKTPGCSGGGWVQVNNTVVPYLRRQAPGLREILNLAPLPVIKYAAGLLTDSTVPSLDATETECKLLSDMCKSAGLDFNFNDNTALILLQQLPVYCATKILIKRLPDDDPFGNAEYCPEFDLDDSKYQTQQQLQRGVMLPTMQDLSPQAYSNRLPTNKPGYITGPPNVTVQPGANIPFSNLMPGYIPKVSPQQTGTQSLQALEKIAGPPRKKPRSTSSPAGPESKSNTPSSTPRASPAHTNTNPAQKSSVGGVVPVSFPQPMLARPGVPFGTFGQPQILVTAPGVPGLVAQRPGWTPSQKELANMMNMQAAILSGQNIPQAHSMSAPPIQQKIQIGQISSAASTISSKPAITPAPIQEKPKAPSTKSKPEGVDKIQPVEFHGKKISCLVKGLQNEKYALIEAISRVYFPFCSLDEFVKVMTNVLQVPIHQLDRDEEKSFISFYGLPTSSLKCNKVLKLTDLDRLMPQLKYMFRAKDATFQAQPQTEPKATNPSPKPSSPATTEQDSNNNGNQPASATALPPPNPFNANKKTSGGLSSKLGKLEDAVNRLRQNKLMEMEGGSSPVVPQNGTNELGQGQIPRNPFLPK